MIRMEGRRSERTQKGKEKRNERGGVVKGREGIKNQREKKARKEGLAKGWKQTNDKRKGRRE